MAIQDIDLGTIPLDGTDGDTAREAFVKVNENFDEIDTRVTALENEPDPGTVKSVNGVLPNNQGNVTLTPANVGSATAAQGLLASSAVQPSSLGTAAYLDANAFATNEQGQAATTALALAQSAVQPEDLGSAAYLSSSQFASAAQGLLADSAVQPEDIPSILSPYERLLTAGDNIAIDRTDPSTPIINSIPIRIYEQQPENPPLYTFFMVVPPPDIDKPVVSSFVIVGNTPPPLAISSFDATDNVGVTGWWLGETAQTPALSDPKWSVTKPPIYNTESVGSVVVYARARDAAGNISDAASQTVNVLANPYVDVSWPYDSARDTGLFSVAAGSFTTRSSIPFVNTITRTIKSVSVPMRKQVEASYPGVGTVQLQIRSGSNTGTVLATATTAQFTSATVSAKLFTLPANLTLQAGVTYFFVFSLINLSGGDSVYRLLTDPTKGTIWSNYNETTWTSYAGQSPLRLELA